MVYRRKTKLAGRLIFAKNKRQAKAGLKKSATSIYGVKLNKQQYKDTRGNKTYKIYRL